MKAANILFTSPPRRGKVSYENLTTNANFDKYDIRYIIIQVTDRMLLSVKP